MSNELKCPMCGGTLESWIWKNNKPSIKCRNCWFRCNTADLPRIATAMELARATVKNEVQNTGSLKELEEQLAEWSKAEKAVLQAWREER